MLIYFRMNINYDQTVSKREKQPPFWLRSSSQDRQQGTVSPPQFMRVERGHKICLGHAGFVAVAHSYLELTRDTKISDRILGILESLGYRC